MEELLSDFEHEFGRYKGLADQAMAQLEDDEFFHRPAPHVNSVAIIVKHLAGNLSSRWIDFLTTDGEKPNRDRDGEFVMDERDTRSSLLAAWEEGWQALFDTLHGLTAADLTKTVTIRGENHTALQAIVRAMTHAAYHAGQVLYLVRMLRPASPWLTVPPGKSRHQPGTYRKPV